MLRWSVCCSGLYVAALQWSVCCSGLYVAVVCMLQAWGTWPQGVKRPLRMRASCSRVLTAQSARKACMLAALVCSALIHLKGRVCSARACALRVLMANGRGWVIMGVSSVQCALLHVSRHHHQHAALNIHSNACCTHSALAAPLMALAAPSWPFCCTLVALAAPLVHTITCLALFRLLACSTPFLRIV